jgi:hypothetical protein
MVAVPVMVVEAGPNSSNETTEVCEDVNELGVLTPRMERLPVPMVTIDRVTGPVSRLPEAAVMKAVPSMVPVMGSVDNVVRTESRLDFSDPQILRCQRCGLRTFPSARRLDASSTIAERLCTVTQISPTLCGSAVKAVEPTTARDWFNNRGNRYARGNDSRKTQQKILSRLPT